MLQIVGRRITTDRPGTGAITGKVLRVEIHEGLFHLLVEADDGTLQTVVVDPAGPPVRIERSPQRIALDGPPREVTPADPARTLRSVPAFPDQDRAGHVRDTGGEG